MKRILTQWAVAGVLLLGAPVAAGAASLQQAGEAGAAQYLPISSSVSCWRCWSPVSCSGVRTSPRPLEPGERRNYGSAGGVVCRGVACRSLAMPLISTWWWASWCAARIVENGRCCPRLRPQNWLLPRNGNARRSAARPLAPSRLSCRRKNSCDGASRTPGTSKNGEAKFYPDEGHISLIHKYLETFMQAVVV